MALQNHEIAVAEYYTRAAAYLVQPEDAENLKEQEESLGKDYLKTLQEDEKKSVAISMIIQIYFKNLLRVWREVELARKQISATNRKAMMFDKAKREALGREQRETIAKIVGLTLLNDDLPTLAARKDEMLAEIVRSADGITQEPVWPFASLMYSQRPRLIRFRQSVTRIFRS